MQIENNKLISEFLDCKRVGIVNKKIMKYNNIIPRGKITFILSGGSEKDYLKEINNKSKIIEKNGENEIITFGDNDKKFIIRTLNFKEFGFDNGGERVIMN